MKTNIMDKISLPDGMYKVINHIQGNETKGLAIYEVEDLGLIKLSKWNGDEYLSVSKVDTNYQEIENLNIILKPKHFITVNKVIHESNEVLYFYCK